MYTSFSSPGTQVRISVGPGCTWKKTCWSLGGRILVRFANLLSKVPEPVYIPPAVLDGCFLTSQPVNAFIQLAKSFHPNSCEIGICLSLLAGEAKLLFISLLATRLLLLVLQSWYIFILCFLWKCRGEMVLFSLVGRNLLHILDA